MIRPAGPADIPAVQAIAEAAYGRYIAAIGRRPAPMDADLAAHVAAGRLDVITRDGRILGYLVTETMADHMFLDSVAVHPDAAGRGLGRQLIAHCEDRARALGLAEVRLYTNAAMIENQAIYPRLGYVEIDRRLDEGFQRVFYVRRLSP